MGVLQSSYRRIRIPQIIFLFSRFGLLSLFSFYPLYSTHEKHPFLDATDGVFQIIVHGSSIAVFTLGKRLNTLSFTITYTQDNATSQASAQSAVVGWAARLPSISITSRKRRNPVKKADISAPQNGRPLNADTFHGEGGPISMSAIGRTDISVDTAPEAARRREAQRAEMGDLPGPNSSPGDTEATLEEKVNERQQAWRIGDEILIEDEQGEVIRQITSPHHPAGQMKGPENDEEGGITERLKRMWSGRSRRRSSIQQRTPRDLEKAIPQENHVNKNKLATGGSLQSSSKSTKLPPIRSPPRAAGTPIFVVDEDTRRMPSISPREVRRAREERDEETEVERRRREAIFGGISDDSDDEDKQMSKQAEKGKGPASSSAAAAPANVSSLAVVGDSDDDEESSLSGSSGAPENSNSSGSRPALLAPPAAPRMREIRFGDISVGTESFSLEEGPPSPGGGSRHSKTGSGDWRMRWNK